MSVTNSSEFAAYFTQMVAIVEQAVEGHPATIENALVCLLAEGHVLLEDVPGVGKTSLARGIANILRDGSVSRIQCTPDLLPSDIVGTTIYLRGTGDPDDAGVFRFQEGPIFKNVVLCDEINRASPRTQAALLEAMGERQVSVLGVPHPLDLPFLVVATQNPVENVGTFPLPEAQLDRFLMRLSLGYPDQRAEVQILKEFSGASQAGSTQRGNRGDGYPLSAAVLRELIEFAAQVRVRDNVLHYIVALIGATRSHPRIRLGASPRAGVGLLRAARVKAALAHRDHVWPDDVMTVAVDVLAHRLSLHADVDTDPLAGAAPGRFGGSAGSDGGPGHRHPRRLGDAAGRGR